MLGEIRGEVRFKEPLSFHTSLRIGGPADFFIVPQDVEDIRLALAFAEQEQLPVEVVGRRQQSARARPRLPRRRAEARGLPRARRLPRRGGVAGAGVSLSALIREAAALNLGGIECLVGIPATIGGAVAMNAGTPDGCIGDFVSAVYFLHPDGTLGEFKPGAGAFGYRSFAAPGRGAHRRAARLHRRPVRRDPAKDIKQRLKQKKSNQPLALASAGCVWKNPPGEAACEADREGGARRASGYNGAEISAKHANFIVNRGGAMAADIMALMDMTRERVQNQFGIALEPEIKILGEGSDGMRRSRAVSPRRSTGAFEDLA